jgi:hypothetical protein
MSLINVGQQITFYGSFFFLITGLFGNGMMIFIFSSVRALRIRPCTFYFLIGSICNILYLLINLPIDILAVGYGNDITNISSFLCKGQNFMTGWLALISFTCSCLSAMDQFFVTSKSVSLRRYSRIKWAHRIVLISMIIWCLHEIPVLVFFDISPITKICLNTNSNYATYVSIYILVHVSAIPVLIIIVFGCLTYRNIRQTISLARQRVDRLITKINLIQVGLILISNTPFGIFYAYSLITVGVNKSINRLMEESFIILIFNLISYFYYVVCISFEKINKKRFFCNLIFRELSIRFLFYQFAFDRQ